MLRSKTRPEHGVGYRADINGAKASPARPQSPLAAAPLLPARAPFRAGRFASGTRGSPVRSGR